MQRQIFNFDCLIARQECTVYKSVFIVSVPGMPPCKLCFNISLSNANKGIDRTRVTV